MKSIKPNKLHILLLLCAGVNGFIYIQAALLEILDKFGFVNIVQKIKSTKLLYSAIGHRNSHLDRWFTICKVAFKVFSFKVPRNILISTVSELVRFTAV